MRTIFAALLLLASNVGLAQTSSGIARHVVWGTSLPATCSPQTGDVFFLITGGTGALQVCSATNTWSAAGGGGGSPGGSSGQIQVNSSGSFGGQAFIMSGGTGEVQRAVDISYWTLTSGGNLALPAQTTPYTYTLKAAMSCNTRWEQASVVLTTQASGGTGVLQVELQHNGTDLMPAFSLTANASGTIQNDRPGMQCSGSSTADLTLVFTGDGTHNLSGYTTLVLTVEVVAYAAR